MKILAYALVIAVIALAIGLEAWVPFHPLASFLILAGVVTIGFFKKGARQ